MKKSSIFYFTFIFFMGCTDYISQQDQLEKVNPPLLVRLIENAADFTGFGESGLDVCTETFKYLGEIKDNSGLSLYKIALHESENGTNCRENSGILVFSDDEMLLGYYYTDGMLPTQILNNGLFFDGVVIGDFSNGIPEKLDIGDGIFFEFQKIEK